MELKKQNLKTANEEGVKFLFLSSNREVQNYKFLRESIVKRGVLTPVVVIRAIDIDGEVELHDGTHIITKEELTEHCYVILDGQHRYKTIIQLIQNEEKAKKNKTNEEVEEIKAELPYLVMTKEEVGNLNEYMIELNSTSKNWKSGDYIDNAAKVKAKMTRADEINYLRDKDCDIKIKLEKIINECVEKYIEDENIDREKLKELKAIEYLNNIQKDKIDLFLNVHLKNKETESLNLPTTRIAS